MRAICAIFYSQRTDGLISGMPRFGECRGQSCKGIFLTGLPWPGHLQLNVERARTIKRTEKKRLPDFREQAVIGNDKARHYIGPTSPYGNPCSIARTNPVNYLNKHYEASF